MISTIFGKSLNFQALRGRVGRMFDAVSLTAEQQLGAMFLCCTGLLLMLGMHWMSPTAPGADELKGPYHLVDLNSADEHELALLPGIGPERARRLVELRAALGEIRGWREVESVKGIGAATVQAMQGMCGELEP